MYQSKFSCSDVQTWLQTLSVQTETGLIDPQLIDHVRGCALCRGAVYAILTPDGLPSDPRSISCEECQDGLAAFISAEIQEPMRAMLRYPQVWQHLWGCLNCLETYEILSAVLKDEPTLLAPGSWSGQNTAPAPPNARPHKSRFKPLLVMLRTALVGLPTPFEFARGYRNGTIERQYLLRRDQPYTIAGLNGEIVALWKNDGTWTIEVSIHPLTEGRLSASIGAYQHTTAINHLGVAQFTAIPTIALISETTALRLELEIPEV